MKTDVKKLPNSQLELETTLDLKEFEKYWQPVYETAVLKVSVKGFRPGAAPKEMVEPFLDHDKIFQDALRDAVRVTLREYTDANNTTLIDQPRVEVLDAKDSVKYKAIITVFPEIKLGNYKKIAKKVFSDRQRATVSDEEVTKSLEWLAKSRAAVVRVSREAKIGDVAETDVQTLVEGKPLEGASLKGERFVLGESHFIKGFDEKLVGSKEGAELKFSLTAAADYWQENLRGKTLDFTVKVLGVYERQAPALDDAFAQSLGPNFKTYADLKKSAHEGLLQEKQEREDERLRIKVLDEVVKDSKMELPEVMIERTLNSMVEDMKRMVPPASGVSPEEHDKRLRESLKDRAQKNVQGNLVVYKIAQEEKLEPTQEEIEKDAEASGVDLEKHYDYSYGKLQNQKVFKFLEKQASE